MLALDFILVLGLLGGVGDASGKGLEEVGGVHCVGGDGRCQLEVWKDVLLVEAGAQYPHSLLPGAMEKQLSSTCP